MLTWFHLYLKECLHTQMCSHTQSFTVTRFGLHADDPCRPLWTWADDEIYVTQTLTGLRGYMDVEAIKMELSCEFDHTYNVSLV